MDQAPPEFESDLVNVNELTLREVLALDDSVLGHALRRLWHEADQPEDIVAGHSVSV